MDQVLAKFHELASWTVTLLPPGLLVAWFIKVLIEPDIRLWPHFNHKTGEFRFGIYNADDEPLRDGVLRVTVKPLSKTGRFICRPELLRGPHSRDVKIAYTEGSEAPTDAKSEVLYEVVARYFRARSTWVLIARTNMKEGDVRLRVQWWAGLEKVPEDAAEKPTFDRVMLGQKHRAQPAAQWWHPVAGTGLALLTFLAPVVVPSLGLPTHAIEVWDLVYLALIAVISIVAFFLCRRSVPPVVLGHLAWKSAAEGAIEPASEPATQSNDGYDFDSTTRRPWTIQ